MDKLSVIGILVAVVGIFLGNYIEGGSPSSLLNGAAALIVIGGSLGAALLQTPSHLLLSSLKNARQVFIPDPVDFTAGKLKISQWATIARREGLLGIEHSLDKEKDSFIQKALEMLVDGYEPHIICDIMHCDITLEENRSLELAKFFDAMGGYAPTLGILGAVLGLIQVMGNLADPSELGHGIAVAFVATIYGVGLANLVFLPVAEKLKYIAQNRATYQEMMTEGIVSIADGQNPRSIEIKLKEYA